MISAAKIFLLALASVTFGGSVMGQKPDLNGIPLPEKIAPFLQVRLNLKTNWENIVLP